MVHTPFAPRGEADCAALTVCSAAQARWYALRVFG
jgi:hypothetical protein